VAISRTREGPKRSKGRGGVYADSVMYTYLRRQRNVYLYYYNCFSSRRFILTTANVNTLTVFSSKSWCCVWINESLDHDCPSENIRRSCDMSQNYNIFLPPIRTRCTSPSRNLQKRLVFYATRFFFDTKLFILFVPQTDCKFWAIHMGHVGTLVNQMVQTSVGVRQPTY